MEIEEFRRLVLEAFKQLPRRFQEKIENVAVEIDERVMNQAGRLILGQYQGVPLTSRSTWYGNILPDRIVIYKGSIERLTNNPEEIRSLVVEVVKHEIGHYFGLDEEQMAVE